MKNAAWLLGAGGLVLGLAAGAAWGVDNTRLVYEVSTDNVQWSSSIHGAPGQTIYARALVSYIAGSNTATPIGLASLVFQPTVSNWDSTGPNTDLLLPFVNNGAGGNNSTPSGIVSDSSNPTQFGRLSPWGRTILATTNSLTGHVNTAGDINFLRIAQRQATSYIGGLGNTSGGVGIPISQLGDVGRTSSDPAFNPGLTNITIFKFGFVLSADAAGRVLTIAAPAVGFGNLNTTTGQREVYWYGALTEQTGQLRGTPVVTSAEVLISSIFNLEPASRSVTAGENVSFTVQVNGDNPQYQWRRNGVPLEDEGRVSGSHTATLFITSALQADEGVYDVDVTTSLGHEVSSGATLAVAGIITQQPNDVTVTAGQLATLSVQVAGSNPQYQWRRNGVALVDGPRLTGSRSSTLRITPAYTPDAGTYDVYVTANQLESVSRAALLTVNCVAPVVVQQPLPLRLNQCQTATLSIVVDSLAQPATYQWRRNGLNLSDGSRISGSRAATLRIHPIGTVLGGNYDVLYSNGCGSGQSGVVVIEVASPADFDGDSDIGTDADIEAFFRCLAGNCCGTCFSVDFDGDDDVGTDRDIEAFFRALAGGSC